MSSTAAANLTFLKWYYDGDESELFLRSNNMTGLQNGDFFVSKAAAMTTNTSNSTTTALASNNSGGIHSTKNFVHSSMPNLNSTKMDYKEETKYILNVVISECEMSQIGIVEVVGSNSSNAYFNNSPRLRRMNSNMSITYFYIEYNKNLRFDSVKNLIEFFMLTKTAIKTAHLNKLIFIHRPIPVDQLILRNSSAISKSGSSLFSSKTNLSIEEKKTPSKPSRVPTIKSSKRPEYLLKKVEGVDVNDEEAKLAAEEEKDRFSSTIIQRLNLDHYVDINPPSLRLKSLIDLSIYKSELIKEPGKHLDRLALIEIKQALLTEWKSHYDNQISFVAHLAKCFTYNDIQLMRFSVDFGLGVYNGIELATLPQGQVVRRDIIERHKTSSLFLMLIVLLCQNMAERAEMIAILLDCALYLFERLKNLFAFGYFMEALNSEHITRLTQTWEHLKLKSSLKASLYNNLNQKYSSLIRGEFFHVEQQALLPNIYPIMLLLEHERHIGMKSLERDTRFYMPLSDVYLSTNGRYITQNATNYSSRCELFTQAEYSSIFGRSRLSGEFNRRKSSTSSSMKPTTTNLPLKLFAISQIEFEQIILWSNDFTNTYYSSSNNLNNYSRNYNKNNTNSNINSNSSKELIVEWPSLFDAKFSHSNEIFSILSSKIQSTTIDNNR